MIVCIGELLNKLQDLDQSKKVVIETTRYDWKGKVTSIKEIIDVEERKDEDCYIIKVI